MNEARASRTVRTTTVNISPKADLDSLVTAVLDAVTPEQDLIVLPESCRGVGLEVAERCDGPTITALSRVASQTHSYLLAGLYSQDKHGIPATSAVLLDRRGELAGWYDKRYPYWSELAESPQPRPGHDTAVWNTDFGALGVAICFDINFPAVWSDLAQAGADLVVWPSAYSGGSILGSYAQIHHYYVLSCTQTGASQLFDPTGRERPATGGSIGSSKQFSIDFSERVYHENFNSEALERLLSEHPEEVALDRHMSAEQWYVLRAKQTGLDIRSLAHDYGLEELQDYIRRSRTAIDQLRGEYPNETGVTRISQQ